MKKLFLIGIIFIGAQLFWAKSASAVSCNLTVNPTSGSSGTNAVVNWSVMAADGDVNAVVDFGNGEGDSDAGFKRAGKNSTVVYSGSNGTIFDIQLWGDADNNTSCYKAATFRVGGITNPPKQCNNGFDDDGDNYIDYPNDCGCSDPNDNSESGSCQNPVAWVNLDVTTVPEGMRWGLFCPGGPYTCQYKQGTGTQYITNPNSLCNNGQCAGAGTYSIVGQFGVNVFNPGYDCVGNSDYRVGEAGTQDIVLILNCTPVATPTPTATATPTPTTTPTATPTPTNTATPIPSPNTDPIISGVSFTEPDYCALGPGGTVNWTYSDADADPQASYQLQVDTNNGFSSPDIDQTVNTSGTSASISNLSFGSSYYLRMRVTDSRGGVSAWANMATCTGPGCSGKVIKSWTTPAHRYPNDLNFTWSPTNPLANQVVTFNTSTTTCYNSANNPVACASYTWNWADGSPSEAGPNPTPAHTFAASNTYLVTLRATDSEGYTCPATSFQKAVIIGKPVPSWKEVIPR